MYARSASKLRRSYSQMSPRKPLMLPRLPVPNLRATLDRYLVSLQPFLAEDEKAGGPSYDSAYAHRVELANEFEKGLGKIAQQRLIELDKKSPYNWLDDNFWTRKAYLEWRAPLPVNTNWWLSFHNDALVPSHVVHGSTKGGLSGYTPWQVRRGAWLVHRFLQFREDMASQELSGETTRKGIWLQENVAKFFNSCRIPQESCDTIYKTSVSDERSTRQIVVMAHDWFYQVDVYDEHRNLLSPAIIESNLREVIVDVDRRLQKEDHPVPVGVLTADNRDVWSKNLKHLLSLSTNNERTFKSILNSVLCLSLDNYTLGSASENGHLGDFIDSPTEVDAHLSNLRSGRSARNRWFDKTATIIVESNTRAGAMGEHSPLDALVPSIVAEYGVVGGIDRDAFGDDAIDFPTYSRPSSGWDRLDWVTDHRIAEECTQAIKRAEESISNSDHSVLWFDGYGADWIKFVAQLSPDAFIQMALQLTWYRLRGEFTATYETVLTRMFQRGRTETVRSLSSASRNFVLSMMDPQSSAHTRLNLLKTAAQHHGSITREAATGRGIDRHLLGLQLMLRPEDGDTSPLFKDPLFQRSQTWKLSTSGLSAGLLFRGTGFGAAYDDGYGINYLAAPDLIKFGIESKHDCPLTSTADFKSKLVEVLEEMKDMCIRGLHEQTFDTNQVLRSHL